VVRPTSVLSDPFLSISLITESNKTIRLPSQLNSLGENNRILGVLDEASHGRPPIYNFLIGYIYSG